MKMLLLVAVISNDSLPPLETLFASIDSFYQLKITSELQEYQFSKKGEWLKFLPTVGLTYTLDGKPRPAVNFSSSVLYRARKDKQAIASKRKSIISKNLLETQTLKAEVEEMALQYYTMLREQTMKNDIFKIDQQLFDIVQSKYDRLELAPSEYLQAKRQFLVKQKERNLSQERILQLKRQILVSYYFSVN